MRTGAVIPAAGKSSRMGKFKPLLMIGNHSAAERLILTLQAAGIKDIALITGNNAESLENSLKHCNVVFLRNELFEHNEMFDSIKIGLGYMKDKCDKILLTPVDVPIFSVETVKKLLKSVTRVSIPTCNQKTGHPIVISSELVDGILNYSGSGGLKGALKELSPEIGYIETGDAGILLDMDTPSDYREATKLYTGKP